MKKIYFLVLLLFSSGAFAEHVNLVFNNAPIIDVVNFYYKHVKKERFIFLPEVLNDTRTITIDTRGIPESNIDPLFNSLLASFGWSATLVSDVWILSNKDKTKLKEAGALNVSTFVEDDFLKSVTTDLNKDSVKSNESKLFNNEFYFSDSKPCLYFPKNRPVSLLVESLSSLGYKIDETNKQSDFLAFPLSKSKHDEVLKILKKIDIPEPQVYLRAFIYEVDLSESSSNAIALIASLFRDRLGVKIDVAPQNNQFSLKLGDFSALLSVLAKDSRFYSLASPSLRVLSGSTAYFSSGADVPVLGAIQENEKGNIRQSVTYQPSGVILEVTPVIFGDNVNLNINQQLSSFVTTSTGVNNSPTLNKRELKTKLSSKFEDLIVIGGMREYSQSYDSSGVSFFPDFLRSKTRSKINKEILIILRTEKV